MCSTTLAIIAGGHGTRLGGVDKGLLTLPDGTPLLAHLLSQLNQHPWKETLIICRPDQAAAYRPLIGAARLVFDHYGPGLGPMAALHTALQSAACDRVQLWPIDAPVVCHELLRALDQISPPALIPQDETGRLQPLFGRYHISLLPHLTQHLAEQRLAITRWLQDIQAPTFSWADRTCFTNLNEPSDLTVLKEIQ